MTDPMNSRPLHIYWFRTDLRLEDQPHLANIPKQGRLLFLYVRDHLNDPDAAWAEARSWWLDKSLRKLQKTLNTQNQRLFAVQGEAHEIVKKLHKNNRVAEISFRESLTPWGRSQQEQVHSTCLQLGVKCTMHAPDHVLHPSQVTKEDGTPYLVYTAYWKRLLKLASKIPEVQHEPADINIPPPPQEKQVCSCLSIELDPEASLDQLNLQPQKNWADDFCNFWEPGSISARSKLNEFSQHSADDYHARRDRPDIPGTSRLSPHLAFGEISPLRIWHTLRSNPQLPSEGREVYLKEIIWRDFAANILFHRPTTVDEPLREAFNNFAWRGGGPSGFHDPAAQRDLRAWQKGQTGYPLVDAGMRELWKTGWMHNRVRMICASFLTKHLRIHWMEGARWFAHTLVDYDVASNTMGWQWVAGCGADAAPYFRIFNPITQSKKFDPEGRYIKTWVPELRHISSQNIHFPHGNTKDHQKPCLFPPYPDGKEPIATYPRPIVDHAAARAAALAAYHRMKNFEVHPPL